MTKSLTQPHLNSKVISSVRVNNAPLDGQKHRAGKDFAVSFPKGTLFISFNVSNPAVKVHLKANSPRSRDPILVKDITNGKRVPLDPSLEIFNTYYSDPVGAKAPFTVEIVAWF